MNGPDNLNLTINGRPKCVSRTWDEAYVKAALAGSPEYRLMKGVVCSYPAGSDLAACVARAQTERIVEFILPAAKVGWVNNEEHSELLFNVEG